MTTRVLPRRPYAFLLRSEHVANSLCDGPLCVPAAGLRRRWIRTRTLKSGTAGTLCWSLVSAPECQCPRFGVTEMFVPNPPPEDPPQRKYPRRFEFTTSPGNIRFVRSFEASCATVFTAHTDVAILPRWALGPGGWRMPICLCDARSGGSFHFVWANSRHESFRLTGEFLEVVPFRRIVHTETLHLPRPIEEILVETHFEQDGFGCVVTRLMSLQNSEFRTRVLASNLVADIESSYERLDQVLGG